jgi:hypothetical protein
MMEKGMTDITGVATMVHDDQCIPLQMSKMIEALPRLLSTEIPVCKTRPDHMAKAKV